MANYLRFTIDEYNAIARASAPLPLTGAYAGFQQALAGGLRQGHPALAEKIAGLPEKLVRVLREYLAGQRAAWRRRPVEGPAAKGEPGCELSLQEWQAVSRACSLVWLHNDSLPPVKGYLVQQLAAESPGLAEKLTRLSDGQFARLASALKSGRRCFAP